MAHQAKSNPANFNSSLNSFPTHTQTKFALYNQAGREKDYYLVDQTQLNTQSANIPEKSVAHSIIIIDRSGSMHSDIEPLKEMLIKLLTLEEYRNSHLAITLISYASDGDVTCHFARVPIQKVMEHDSDCIKEIRKIRVTGATCISQALQLAQSLIQEGELTAITLHSDGYANDPSASKEANTLEAICEQLKSMDVFLNTIAYSYSSDFKLLSKLANTVSGSCIKAASVKEIYDSLYSTAKLLDSAVLPPLEEPLLKDYDYQVFVSKSAKKINGSSGKLKICGLKLEDDGVFYKYQKLTKADYDALAEVPVIQTDDSVFAFAKANLAEGNLNTAKYALGSSFDATLAEKHTKALTNAEIAEFAQDLEQVIFESAVLRTHEILSEVKVNERISLLELIKILEKHSGNILLNIKHLQDDYQRKGLKRIEGYRDAQGNLVKPDLKTEYLDSGNYVRMGSFDINRNTATINMLITSKVKLVKVEDQTPITEVAGVLVSDLESFNSYTVVCDGELNVKSLRVKISTKDVFELLKEEGVLEKEGTPADQYDFRGEYDIRFDHLPIVPSEGRFGSLDGVFEELAQIKVLSSILAAHLKEESASVDYLPEQLEELKKHYLSKNLYLNFPTTTEYTDLQEALANGTVDSRVSYKIDIGNADILNLGKLYSANKFLDRMYEVYDADTAEKIEKPTFEVSLDRNCVFGHKSLSSRCKLTKVDELMKRIFDNFLGIENDGTVAAILSKVDADSLLRLLADKWDGKPIKRNAFVSALKSAKVQLEAYAENVYREKISPLVFYIGSTGLMPDEMDAKAQTADELSSKYGNLQFSKDEQEGTFFEVGHCIISVYAKNEYYSTK